MSKWLTCQLYQLIEPRPLTTLQKKWMRNKMEWMAGLFLMQVGREFQPGQLER